MAYIKRSECKRLFIVFEKVIPGMHATLKSEDIINSNQIIKNHIPKLKLKCINLASKCITDDNCPQQCKFCTKSYIEDVFNSFLINIDSKNSTKN